MKELAFVMFLFGCGYVLVRLINHFTASQARELNFSIPSTGDTNIIWGFIFYLGFIALKVPSLKIYALLAILVLFGLLFYFRGLSRCLQNSRPAFFKNEIIRRLIKQKNNDTRLNKPYTRKEALQVLGLSAGIPDNNPQIEKRLALLEKFSAANPDCPHLPSLIIELRSALK